MASANQPSQNILTDKQTGCIFDKYSLSANTLLMPEMQKCIETVSFLHKLKQYLRVWPLQFEQVTSQNPPLYQSTNQIRVHGFFSGLVWASDLILGQWKSSALGLITHMVFFRDVSPKRHRNQDSTFLVVKCFIDVKGGNPHLCLDSIWHRRGPALCTVLRLNRWNQRSSRSSFICVLLSQTKVDSVMIMRKLVIITLSLLWLPLLCVAVRVPLWSFLYKFLVIQVLRMRTRSPSSQKMHTKR